MIVKKILPLLKVSTSEEFASEKSRRQIFGWLLNNVKKALAASPLALSLRSEFASGQSLNQAVIFERLNLILALQIAQSTFYQACYNPSNTNPPVGQNYSSTFNTLSNSIKQGLIKIDTDQLKHIQFLTSLFPSTAKPVNQGNFTFDFTINHSLQFVASDPATNPPTDPINFNLSLLLLAQALKDLSVRCIKGMIQKFTGSADLRIKYLPGLLGMHSIEARHAGYIRLVRKTLLQPVKPWITLDDSIAPVAVGLDKTSAQANLFASIYQSENNINQAQINLLNLNGHSEINDITASEAFDEILTQEQVKIILKNIIVTGLT